MPDRPSASLSGNDPSLPKRLLALGAGPAQLGLLQAAKDRGLYVIAADRDPAAPGFRHADRRAIISVEDESGIDRLASAESVDGIIAPGIDWPVGIAARVAERLGLPHPLTPAAATLSTSKLRQRETFAAAGVPHPRYRMCGSQDDALAAAREIGFPAVVKAPDRQGQRGLSLVPEPAALPEAVERALAASRGGGFLIEELVEGREITVNGFSHEGRFHPLTVTDRVVAEPPAFGVALAHVWPSSLEPIRIGAAIQAAASAAAAIGIEEGPTYTQILVPSDVMRPVFVGELAARLGGGHDAELCRAALGVDLNGLALASALGEEIEPGALEPLERVGGACVKFLVAPTGELQSVEGVEEAEEVDGVLGVRVYRSPGHLFGELRRGSDRAGAVLAVGTSAEDALERADRAAESLRFTTVAPAVA
jgi:biotin carboxylase